MLLRGCEIVMEVYGRRSRGFKYPSRPAITSLGDVEQQVIRSAGNSGRMKFIHSHVLTYEFIGLGLHFIGRSRIHSHNLHFIGEITSFIAPSFEFIGQGLHDLRYCCDLQVIFTKRG